MTEQECLQLCVGSTVSVPGEGFRAQRGIVADDTDNFFAIRWLGRGEKRDIIAKRSPLWHAITLVRL